MGEFYIILGLPLFFKINLDFSSLLSNDGMLQSIVAQLMQIVFQFFAAPMLLQRRIGKKEEEEARRGL